MGVTPVNNIVGNSNVFPKIPDRYFSQDLVKDPTGQEGFISRPERSAKGKGNHLIHIDRLQMTPHPRIHTELARNEEDVKLSGKLQQGQAQWDLESEWRQAQLVSNEPDPDSLEHGVDEACSTMKKHQD